MHKLLDKDGAQHLVDKFLSDQDLQDNKLDEIEEKFDGLYSIVGIEHYGIKIDKNNSDTSARIVYTHDCENYTPAHMDYTNGVFEIGSWGNAFFMKNNYPAMCNFYGVEQYKLDPDDHSLKEDGTASDVADETYNGNAMSVFDCHIWMKFWEDENYQYLEVSNYKLDDDFKDYPYVRADGSKTDKLYYPMYPGYKDSNNRLRSISGVKASSNSTTAQEVTYASNCGANWSIGDWSHYLWLHSLMLLISKNLNSQVAFGNGNMSVGSSASYFKTNGLLNASGQFFGYNTSSDSVKAFYCENIYANRFQRLLGFYNDKGTYKIKMVPPYTYDETFEGYTTVSSPAVPSSGYLKDLSFDSSYGLVPKTVGGSATTYVGDYFYTNNAQVDLLLAGGGCHDGANCGSWSLYVYNRAAAWYWSAGASSYLTEPIHFDLGTIYGSSPIYFEQDNYAQSLADYTISGNSYQDGTPSPDDPVEVVSVGEKTENLLDVDADGWKRNAGLNANGVIVSSAGYFDLSPYIEIVGGQIYSVQSSNSGGSAFRHAFYDSNKNLLAVFSANGMGATDQTAIAPVNAKYIRCTILSKAMYPGAYASSMITQTPSAVPRDQYIPYGYKIPVTITNGTDTVTTPVYIGTEPLLRFGEAADCARYEQRKIIKKIGKYEITGKETFHNYENVAFYLLNMPGFLRTTNVGCGVYSNNTTWMFMNSKTGFNDVNAFKSYLAAQYAAGTPVTVWYELPIPIEEDPPVPFPTITPTPGSNTLSIGTTLQPSQVSITGHIKPSSTYGQLLDVNNQAILDKNGDQIFVYGQS